MIIGVSGKINSGKDTVAAIIQYLIWKNKVEKGEKTNLHYTFKDFTNSKFGGNTLSNWEIKKFADKLKDMVSILLGCTREQLEDRVFKETELEEQWWYYKGEVGLYPYDTPYEANKKLPLVKLTPRLLLQLIGTQCGRQIIHPNIWVNATMADYKPIESNIKKSNTFIDGRLKHGYNKTRIFRIYHNIKQRCYNPNHPRYENYGGKGITICDEWNNSIDSFIGWANENGYQEGLTIDRIDNDKEYSPFNCRWVTYSTQAINQGVRKDNISGYKGVSKDKHNWRASIQINKKRKFLGYFDTAEAASEAYEEAFLERENLYGLEEQSNILYPSWCITDVRFPNEAKAIKDKGGILIRVNRPCKECGLLNTHKMSCSKNVIEHESETGLDDYNFNYIIDNTEGIDSLIEQVRTILIKEGII